MYDPLEIFRSVEIVWAAWVVSVAISLRVAWHALFAASSKDASGLLKGEQGAAYSLSYVMTVPFYLFIMCLAADMTLFLVTKTGTMYASYAAARSAAVWESARPKGMAQEKAEQAAAQAMVPFASGSSQHAQGGPSGFPLRQGPYMAAFKLYSKGKPLSDEFLARKFAYAHRNTKVSLQFTPGAGRQRTVTATIRYPAPFLFPAIGRLLGERPSGVPYFVYNIESSVAFPSETPQNETRDIGIDYRSQ